MPGRIERSLEANSTEAIRELRTIGKRSGIRAVDRAVGTSGIADPPEGLELIANSATSEGEGTGSGTVRDVDRGINRVDVGTPGFMAVSMNERFFLAI